MENTYRSTKEKKQFNEKTKEAINHLIESSYGFKNEYVNKKEPTPENILIFDEAQRVWNKEKMSRKHNGDPGMSVSEPHLLYSIMDRHQDWAVMICLVGLGQDNYMETKDIILDLRIKKGLSQEELAEKVFVTRQAVSRWETGETIPNVEILEYTTNKLKKSLGLNELENNICKEYSNGNKEKNEIL